jgi:uridine kinase
LRETRSIHAELDVVEETDTRYRRRAYVHEDVDVILVEGIYLLRRALRPAYDLSCWIECSFRTALARAIARAQEGLSPAETIRAYRTIYFPAQEMHFRVDRPREHASVTIDNEAPLQRSEQRRGAAAR